MEDHEGSIAIVFNGEIYNYQELKKDLEKKGIKFTNTSDTEVLLNGYKYEELRFFKKIRGFYATGIFDAKNNRI